MKTLIILILILLSLVQETTNTCQIVYNGPYRPNGATWVILDHENATTQDIAKAEENDAIPIAYFSTHWENWREDAYKFDNCLLGKISGWKGENYVEWDREVIFLKDPKSGKLYHPNGRKPKIPLIVTKVKPVQEVMKDRLDDIKQKGFVGIDPDNIDGPDGKAYFTWLYKEARKRNLLIGLKNYVEILPEFGYKVDFFVSEAKVSSELSCYKKYIFDQNGSIIRPCFRMHYNRGASTPSYICEVNQKNRGNKF